MAKQPIPKLFLNSLTARQQAAGTGGGRFNFVSGGLESGKTTIADDIVAEIAGTGSGRRVAYLLPDGMAVEAAKRRLYLILSEIIEGAPRRLHFDLTNGSRIYILPLDAPNFELWDHVQMMVIDDAPLVPNFRTIWDGVIWPYLQRTRSKVWVFGKPNGSRDGFGSLFRQAQREQRQEEINRAAEIKAEAAAWAQEQAAAAKEARAPVRRPIITEWVARMLPTSAGRYADKEAIAKAKDVMDPLAFAQEYLGEVLDEPIMLSATQSVIGQDETFLEWCERLEKEGLEVDGHPFKLDDRPTMRWVYSLMPSTREEAFGKKIVLMKCAQVGFTIMEMLVMIYFAIKFMPCKIGMYLPDQNLAKIKSSDRFLPVVRTIPAAHNMLTKDPSGTKKTGEGNVMIRNMGGSRFYFLWTSGKGATESVPLDVVSFDEVQEMAIADMEKTNERLSASRFRFTLMGSTANWPDRDIHFFYKKGTQHQFWTECLSCGTHQILDDHFPDCIRMREGVNPDGTVTTDYRYVCHSCDEVIKDSQIGEWRPKNPDEPMISVHYPQFLSPTISPREIIEAYFNADDMKNFFNRKRGKPYVDPSQVPVDLAMLNECAQIGMEMGVVWKDRAKGTFMGIDQMGAFNVVLIAERLPSGHMAIIHAEEIYADDPFERCDVLMAQYGVGVCVVETLPNYNDAKRFAGRHPGKVFLAHYGDIKDNMMVWGDAVPNAAERKTSEEDRDRYTVKLDQYKCMQVALKRIQSKVCVFPDPSGLVQEVREKGLRNIVPILKDRVFLHFTRTALVADKDDEEKKYRRRVVKVGIDPHFSYAFMLMNVAWARSHGTAMFLMPEESPSPTEVAARVEKAMPGLPSGVINMLEVQGDVCGRCVCFEDGRCTDRGFTVGVNDPGCPIFVPASG